MAPTIGAMTPRNSYRRERGRALLTRINRWTIAAAVGLAGWFSFVAAETTHGKTSGSTTTSSLQQPSNAPSSSSSSSVAGSTSPSSGAVSGGS